MNKFFFSIIIFILLVSCSQKKRKIKVKVPDPIILDSIIVYSAYYGRLSQFNATTKSYVFNDSVSSILINSFKDTTNSSNFRSIKVFTNPKYNPEIESSFLLSKRAYDKILVDFFYPSPDLEIANVQFKKPDKLFINLRGFTVSKNVKDRHINHKVCRIVCKIQIPNNLPNVKVYFEPFPYDEMYIYQAKKEPWISKEVWVEIFPRY